MTTTHSPELIQTYTEHDMLAVTVRADRFLQEGLDAYDDHVIGERRSKVMYLALLAMGASNGMAGIDLGHPGSSKSLMIEIGPKIVDGINDEHISKVPHRMDLQPAKLVGETTEVVRSGIRDGKEFSETMSQELKPILHPGTKAVILDEVTRTSPLAINAGLGIMQNGKITVAENGIESELSAEGIDLIIAASNNFGTAFTNKLDPALIGRFGMGSFTGTRPENGISEVKQTMWSNPSKRYGIGMAGEVNKVIELEELHTIRRAIPFVPILAAEQEYGMNLSDKMLRKMSEVKGVNMADGRSDQQLIRVAQTLALLGNSAKVEKSHIAEAARYFATAKLGLMRGETEASVDDFAASISEAI